MTLELDINKIKEESIERAKELIHPSPKVAEVILLQLLKCFPDDPMGLQLLGLAKHKMQQHHEAIEIFKKAIEVDPNCPENYNNISLTYSCIKDFNNSIKNLEKAISINPDNYVFYSNLGLQYTWACRGKTLDPVEYVKAVNLFRKSLEIKQTAETWNNLGGVYYRIKDWDKCRDCCKKSLEINPSYPAAHVDLSLINLLHKNWEIGFKEYEWRFEHFPQLQFYKHVYDEDKKWDGKKSLKGKRIIIYGEQGLGDLIQFLRYVPKLKELEGHIIIHCDKVLDSFIADANGVDETINLNIILENAQKNLPEYDYHCSIMSLPSLLNDFKIIGKPYLKAKANLNFKKQEAYKNTFNIGISWAGSPAHPEDSLRSTKLKYFKTIHDFSNVKLFSLQINMRRRINPDGSTAGFDYEQRKGKSEPFKRDVDLVEGSENMNIVDMTNLIENFDDSATIISGLDLVITVDTGLLHLAGSLGVPCWGLIAYNPDWRWGLEDNTTEWYDSVRLFRQKSYNDWETVFSEVKDELIKLLK